MDPESSRPDHAQRRRRSGRDAQRIARRAAATVVGLAVVAINLLQACGFSAGRGIETPQDVYDILDESQYVEPYASDRWTVVDDAQLRVEHGWACAAAEDAASQEYIGLRVGGFTKLPKNFDGTVFLNGWHLEYQHKDHHVVGLGTSIFNIVQLNDTLVWNAGGVLSDHNGDDAYRWCYDYTTVAWPRPSTSPFGGIVHTPHVDIQAIVSNPQAQLMYTVSGRAGGVDEIASSFKVKGKKEGRGVLLAGFGVSYRDDDHHVRQIGFDLGKTRVKRKKIKWLSDVVFKDDHDRAALGASIVSVLTGDSVEVFHPASATIESGDATPGVIANDLQLTPVTQTSGACLGDLAARTIEMAVVTPAYTWAMPMLTGWNLGSPCGDNHLRHVGARITDFHYVREAGASTGTLSYTLQTDYGDQDGFPGMFGGAQVDVLGINLLQPVIANPGAAVAG